MNPHLAAIFLIFLLISAQNAVAAQYLVEILERTALGGHRAVVRCDATGANFGEDVVTFSFGMTAVGCSLSTEPPFACSDVTKPQLNSTSQCIVDFAVVPRGNCSFSEKAYYVQTANVSAYSALIVYNAKGQNPVPMSGSKFADLVQIPVVMVKYECMQAMLGHYSAEKGYLVTIKASPGYYDLVKYLFPFVIIVGICFIVLFISLMIRLCRERRRLARKRLPRSYLKKIPTKKYRKGDPEETCAICLEDFQEGEKLRILPCKHAYHCKCIDPWLTKNRKVCPVCKRRVGPRSEDSTDTDETDTERLARSSASSYGEAGSSTALSLSNSRDNDPLLQNAQPMATSSSQDFPYPQASIPSLHQQQPSTSAFARATNLLHLSSIFRPSRCELSSLQPSSTGSGGTNSNAGLTEAQQPGGFLRVSPELEDLSSAGQPQSNASQGPLGRIRSGFSGIRSRLAEMVHRNGSDQNAHLLLENEEDSSAITREELDSLSRRTCETLDETNGGSASLDGHSMTTMHSNREFVEHLDETPNPNATNSIAATIASAENGASSVTEAKENGSSQA